MDTCAGLAYERKRLEHLLEQTSNANRRQEILDQLDDIEASAGSGDLLGFGETALGRTRKVGIDPTF